jgi:predicted 2-oxoglutarate/Fe(II)-dependent dioxygenase YbiX
MYANTNFGYDILKYDEGQYFKEHVDLIPGHACFQHRQLSILVYLNDDYGGGETYFSKQELQLKPPAGSIALFPPFYTHPHTSKPITSGTKYVVVTWLYP